MNATPIFNDIAQVDADAKLHLSLFRRVCVASLEDTSYAGGNSARCRDRRSPCTVAQVPMLRVETIGIEVADAVGVSFCIAGRPSMCAALMNP